jgi:hypothetical protein
MVDGKSNLPFHKGSPHMEIVIGRWLAKEAFSLFLQHKRNYCNKLPSRFRHYIDLILLNFDTWLSFCFLALNEFKFY